MSETKCPYKSGTCAKIWLIGRKASESGESKLSNPYGHPRSPQYTQAWIAGFESHEIAPLPKESD